MAQRKPPPGGKPAAKKGTSRPAGKPGVGSTSKVSTTKSTLAKASAASSGRKPPTRKPGKSIVNQKQTPWGLIASVTAVVLFAAAVVIVVIATHKSGSKDNGKPGCANPANAQLLPQAMAALDTLEAGKPVDTTSMPAPLMPLFNAKVQPFLIDLLSQDPAKMTAGTRLPMLIIRGGKDIQVAAADLEALHSARPDAIVLAPPDMNHVMKDVKGDDRASNLATYGDPALPLDPALADSITAFVKAKR